MALADLYPERGGHAILRRFDLAVASGGGALVLGALMADRSPAQIVEAFRAPITFSGLYRPRQIGAVQRFLRRFGLYPRFETEARRGAIAGLLGAPGGALLNAWAVEGPSETPVCALILAYDYDRRALVGLRSYALEATGDEPNAVSIAEAAHAASAAPFGYHDAPATAGGRRYWDAAVAGCHNPVMAGVTEAMAMGAMPEDIEVLSLGSGSVRQAPPDRVARGGGTAAALLATDPSPGTRSETDRAAERVLEGPLDTACWAAHVTLINEPGEMGRVVRMSPLAEPASKGKGVWDYPKALPAALFESLARLDRSAAGPGEIDLIVRFGEAWIKQGAANQPIRAGDDPVFTLGDATYGAAKRRWRGL